MSYTKQLLERSKSGAPVCVGIDPAMSRLPDGITKTEEGVEQFCKGIIDVVCDIVPVVKLQFAYFEALGASGMQCLYRVAEYAKHRNLLVIGDAKRGDIGETSKAYAQAYLSLQSPFDALTISPYMGFDSMQPFFETALQNEKGVYVLVKTSNPGSMDIQDLPVSDSVLHEHVAQGLEAIAMQHIASGDVFSCIGAVVGATYPEELAYLRTLMPHVPFLLPGVGAQGGSVQDLARGFLWGGIGALVSASRSVIFASNQDDWQQACRHAAVTLANDVRALLATIPNPSQNNALA